MKKLIVCLVLLSVPAHAEDRCAVAVKITSDQRNAAMDMIVQAGTEVQSLRERVKDLEKKLAEAKKPAEAAKP